MLNQEPSTAKDKSDTERDKCVLLIEADAELAAKILGELDSATKERFHVEWVTKLSTGIERLHSGGIRAVALDLTLPDSQGVETFDKLFQAAPRVPIVILIDADAEETARLAVKRGAQDYVVKNQGDGYRLRLAVRTMIERPSAEAISLENEGARLMLDSIGEAILRTDLNGNVTYLNRIAEKMTGWSRKEGLGRPVTDVLQTIDSDSSKLVGHPMETVTLEASAAGGMPKCLNYLLVRRDGSEIGIESTVTRLHDQYGGLSGTLVAFHDVTAARAHSLEMSQLAQHDVLTKLPNRTLFDDRLKKAISLAERQGKQLAVMFVDLDYFKKIHDSLGHGVGDKLLQSVAERLKGCVRRSDTVSRTGGDEFLILLSQVEHEEDAVFSAQKILRAFGEPHLIDGKSLDINVSIGVSTYPTDSQNVEDLKNKADAAMYDAKQRGRNNYQFFRCDMHAQLAERQMLEADLRCALGRNEFVLNFQPKFNLQTRQVTGVEALIRWMHPKRGMLYPAKFVPIAEECGLILPIGRWVLLEACTQARAWSDAGLGAIPVAVNVSAAEFRAKDFLSGVRAVLIATGVEPQNLELELTESVLMYDAESAVVTLTKLKAMGVQIAIDDFGTGYSSFTYLRRFPSDALKLDQSFVQAITGDPGDETIVGAMINLGRSLKQRVIAEGVETRSQLDFLQNHGCCEGQGYYFSPPLSAKHASNLLGVGMQSGVVNH
jgi:diguanylate cyclase (GGDEF)-like protein/PAS domain S-box-containing protein